MKKSCFALFACFFALLCCSPATERHFKALDKAIDLQDYYNLAHNAKQDSLRLAYLGANSDSSRWEAAYALEKILFYHDIESCYQSVSLMMKDATDKRQKTISQCCYANILYKMDSLGTAFMAFRQIDTSAMHTDALGIYCYAGYHIFGKMQPTHPEFANLRREIVDKWWKKDSTSVECAFYRNELLREEGIAENAVERLRDCRLTTPNDTAKLNYFLAKEYLHSGETGQAIKYFAISAECDMRLGVKAYNALYELARILFRTGDIARADRYMRVTLKDAFFSHYESRYEDVIRSELEIMNVLLEQQRQKRKAYYITSIAVALLLLGAMISLVLLLRYSSRLNSSRRELGEVSRIKDSFLANYMEKCVDYLNKVDEYRSTLRRTAKQEGTAGIMAMLRRPSFAAGEFHELLASLDSTFLGIFPDFVEKVNEHMQEEYQLSKPSEGSLSTELRILALIKMGISKRQKIAKILNMSVTTVYSYHCNLQKHSLHPDDSFDRIIASL
ncbi:MAG: hypothetical protein IKH11_04270 [Bacteroidales bacterium]|nr:hypothetical protein [Bacteroidales bacterium]